MKKQVAFWLTMCCRAKYLVLDEPVDGLDPVMRRQVWSLMMGDVAERGTTVLVSSHNLREINEVCDTAALLHNGKIIFSSELDNLKGDIHKLQLAFSDNTQEITREQLEETGLEMRIVMECKANKAIRTLSIVMMVISGIAVAGAVAVIVLDKKGIIKLKSAAKVKENADVQAESVENTETPVDVVEEEKGIILEQMKNDPKNASKPENIKEKMIEGRINKFFESACLVDQGYVKEDKITVGQYTENTAKELGGSIKINSFVKFERGEGLEKKEEDFASEIEKLVNG